MQVQLPYIAAIPVGNEIVIQLVEKEGLFGGWDEIEPVLLDRTTCIVWSATSAPAELTHEAFGVQLHTKELRQKAGSKMLVGRVTSCHVSMRVEGKANHFMTTLGLMVLQGGPHR